MGSMASPIMSPTIDFIDHFTDCMEVLPQEIQRCISQMRELDMNNQRLVEQAGRFMCQYKQEKTGSERRKLLNKIQKCLVRSQHCGDEKLVLINQIVELVEIKNLQITRDAEKVDLLGKDSVVNVHNGNNGGSGNGSRKIEKKADERPSKSLYDKPKRVRRVRTLDKIAENVEKTHKALAASVKIPPKDTERDEKHEMRPSKDSSKKEKEKEKEKEKDTKEKEEKDEKKGERKEKLGKIAKKITAKPSTKLKKKKKKEKESTSEDMAFDPDEPTYCLCNRVSFGDMIGCDNDECSIEWFHFGCVNLTHKPKGKWYCPGCLAERKEKSKKT